VTVNEDGRERIDYNDRPHVPLFPLGGLLVFFHGPGKEWFEYIPERPEPFDLCSNIDKEMPW